MVFTRQEHEGFWNLGTLSHIRFHMKSHRLHNWGPTIFRETMETIHKSCLKPPFRMVFFEPNIHHVAIENRQELHSLPQLVWEAYYAGTVPKGSRGETRRMASMFLKAGLCTGIQMHQCTIRVYIIYKYRWLRNNKVIHIYIYIYIYIQWIFGSDAVNPRVKPSPSGVACRHNFDWLLGWLERHQVALGLLHS